MHGPPEQPRQGPCGRRTGRLGIGLFASGPRAHDRRGPPAPRAARARPARCRGGLGSLLRIDALVRAQGRGAVRARRHRHRPVGPARQDRGQVGERAAGSGAGDRPGLCERPAVEGQRRRPVAGGAPASLGRLPHDEDATRPRLRVRLRGIGNSAGGDRSGVRSHGGRQRTLHAGRCAADDAAFRGGGDLLARGAVRARGSRFLPRAAARQGHDSSRRRGERVRPAGVSRADRQRRRAGRAARLLPLRRDHGIVLGGGL